MCKCFVLAIFYFFVATFNATCFEIEKTNNDYNIVLVRNKRAISGSSSKMTSGKSSIYDSKNINSAVVRTKVKGNNVKTDKNLNTKMYASATGNISADEANKLLNNKDNNANVTTKKKTSEIKKIEKKAQVAKAKKSKTGENSKVVVLYNGNSVSIDNELCKMVSRNDVVNVKKTLSMMKYESKYVNWRCKHNTPLLLLAVEHNNFLVAKLLVEKGANVNLVDNAGVGVLHWIARNKNDVSMDMLSLILGTENVSINIRDIEGYTPLMRAVEFENTDVVNVLLERKADAYIKNNYGENAIKLARKKLESKRTNDNKVVIEKIVKLLETMI